MEPSPLVHSDLRVARNRKTVLKSKAMKTFLSGLRNNHKLSALTEFERSLQSSSANSADHMSGRTLQSAGIKKTTYPVPSPYPYEMRSFHTEELDVTHAHFSCMCSQIWCGMIDNSIRAFSIDGSGSLHPIFMYLNPTEQKIISLWGTFLHVFVSYSSGLVSIFDSVKLCLSRTVSFGTESGLTFTTHHEDTCWGISVTGAVIQMGLTSGETREILFLPAALTLVGNSECICVGAGTGEIVCMSRIHENTQPVTIHCELTLALVIDGTTLFTSLEGGALLSWCVKTGEKLQCLRESGEPIRFMQVDTKDNKLWASTQENIEMYDTRYSLGFMHIQTLRPAVESGSSFRFSRFNFFSLINNSVVWSIASNGQNYIWSTGEQSTREMRNRIEDDQTTFLHQSTKEIDNWEKDAVTIKKNIDSLKTEFSQIGHSFQDTHILRRIYSLWRHHTSEARKMRNQLMRINQMRKESLLQFCRRYFCRLRRNIPINQLRKTCLLHANNSRTALCKVLLLEYWTRWQTFSLQRNIDYLKQYSNKFHREQNERHISQSEQPTQGSFYVDQVPVHENMALFVQRLTQKILLSVYIKKWRNWSLEKCHHRKMALLACNYSYLRTAQLESHFFNWRNWILRRRRKSNCQSIADRFYTMEANRLRQYTLRKWVSWIKECEHQTLKKKASMEREMLQQEEKTAAEIAERKEKLDGLRSELGAAEERLEMLKSEVKELADMKDQAGHVLQQILIDDRSMEDTFDMAIKKDMAQLRGRVINFFSDYPIMSQMYGTQTKIQQEFFEAHDTVRRLVCHFTKESNPPNRWPLNPDLINEMPCDQMSDVLHSVKTMVIAFDMMNQNSRTALKESLVEIHANVDLFLKIANVCICHIQVK